MSRAVTVASMASMAILITLCGTAAAQPAPFTGPAETFDAKTQLPPLQAAIQSGNFVDAAARIDALLHDLPDALLATDPAVLVSLRVWAESLPAASRASLSVEYDKLNAAAAKQALDAAIVKPAATPEDFLAVASTYPLSGVCGEAIGRAALRSADYGDAPAVAVLFKRATDLGWKPTAAQRSILESVAKLNLPLASGVAIGTPWYAAYPPPLVRHVIPVAAGGSVFVSTERGVLAAKDGGELLWQFVNPKADASSSGVRAGFNRPAVLCDPAGKPQVVVVRHVISGTRFGCLRAFRAADGKLLWSSETTPGLGSWSMVSAPVVSGRVTLVISIDETARPAPVGVTAFETMTGRLLWQTTIGTYAGFTESRDPAAPREADALWRSSGVAIDGGDVFVTTNAGLTACLDRFDGKIRWTRTYTPSLSAGDELIQLGRKAVRSEPGSHEPYRKRLAALKDMIANTPLDVPADANQRRDWRDVPVETLMLGMYFSIPVRWMSTPSPAGDSLIVAAEDMAGVVALDRKTGAQLWEIPDEQKTATLLGVSGDNAVFAEKQLTAIDVHTAKPRWTWDSPANAPLDGPGAFAGPAGRSIRVVAGKTTYVVNADTGKPDPLTPVGPSIGPLLNNEPTRNALINIDALSAIATPAAKPDQAKKK